MIKTLIVVVALTLMSSCTSDRSQLTSQNTHGTEIPANYLSLNQEDEPLEDEPLEDEPLEYDPSSCKCHKVDNEQVDNKNRVTFACFDKETPKKSCIFAPVALIRRSKENPLEIKMHISIDGGTITATIMDPTITYNELQERLSEFQW